MNKIVQHVTENIIRRSLPSRQNYLQRMQSLQQNKPHRRQLSCGNLAHGFAACNPGDKQSLKQDDAINIAIVSSYNDMLSAHQPLSGYPRIIKQALHEQGAVAQVAGGVPAMCDGVTQGQPGMELSLFSRDVIAMSTAVALSHNMFDGVLCLGVCDKIVPGLLIGALSFAYLPVIFVPAGPMTSGVANKDKHAMRQLYAEGKTGRGELLAIEEKSYHGPGTCTFYGTANSNQVLMEVMGLHLPGASFVNANTDLREQLTRQAAKRITELTAIKRHYTPLYQVVSEKSLVNGIIALLATGGSTNHTMHLVAIAKAAGIIINWEDFAELSKVCPLLARIYPNGEADINHFQAAGGMSFLIRELLDQELLHEDVHTIQGLGLQQYLQQPYMEKGKLNWRDGLRKSVDETVLRPGIRAFSPQGGLQVLSGNLGRAVVKVSAVAEAYQKITASVVVVNSQDEFLQKYQQHQFERDCVVVVRFQGPKANGMPELHKLTPYLGVLQDKGFKVALITDGRMSGASGKVLAVIHCYPEAAAGGQLAKLEDGDVISIDCPAGKLMVNVDEQIWLNRKAVKIATSHQAGMGRELFQCFRDRVSDPEQGGSVL